MSIEPSMKLNMRGSIAVLLILVMIVSALIVRIWVNFLAVAVYLIATIIPYAIGVILLTRQYEKSFEDPVNILEAGRLLMCFHISLGLLTIGLWLSIIFRLSSVDLTIFFISYFIVGIGAGMAIPYLIWRVSK